MTVTDEPGYYEDGSFGIRIESVLVVKQVMRRIYDFDLGCLTLYFRQKHPITLRTKATYHLRT